MPNLFRHPTRMVYRLYGVDHTSGVLKQVQDDGIV
jgi:hypothetical protein